MPTLGHTAQTEQRILNDSKDSLYDTIATTLFAETGVGTLAQRVTGSAVGSAIALHVALVDGAGSQITSFGGGTQYTEGDTDATITGTALMWEDAANTLVVASATKPLPVSASIDTTGLATDATDTNTGTIAGDTTSIDGKTPALGQALAAASVPVVLTAAQEAALTPPAAITGFATSAKQDTLLTELQAKADLTETQPVGVVPLTSCGSGVTTVTTAGTQVALGSSTAIDSVTIKALSTNTGLIYVGTSTVSSADGFQLSAGDSVSLDVDNLTDVYIDSAVDTEGVSYIWVS